MKLIPYIQLTAFIFPFYGLFAVYTGYYNGLHNFKRQAMLNICYACIKTVVVIGFVYVFHLFGAIIAFIISPFLSLLFFMHIPKKTLQHFPYKKIILFSLPLIGVAIFSNLLQTVDLFFVKALLHSNKDTGFYTASQNVSIVPFYGIVTLSSVLFPSISKSVSQNLHDRARKIISTALRFALLLLIPTILLLSATSSQLITFIYSSAYQPGAAALAILLIGEAFFTFFTLLATIISGAGSPNHVFILSGIGLGITSLLCRLLIPLFGLQGAAFSTTSSAFFIMTISFVLVYKRFHVFLPIQSIIKVFLSSAIIFVLAKIIAVPFIFLPILYLVLFSLYLGFLFLMKEFTKDDFVLIASLLPGWLSKKIAL